MGDIVHFDQSTWQAKRVADALELGPPQLPEQVVLPGMKIALAHDRLLAHQAAGNDQHAIVAHENERWRKQNADRLQAHARWITGPYTAAIEEMRRQQMEAAAEELRKRALFERLMAERESERS